MVILGVVVVLFSMDGAGGRFAHCLRHDRLFCLNRGEPRQFFKTKRRRKMRKPMFHEMFMLACISTNMLSNIKLLCSATPFFVHGQWMAEGFGVCEHENIKSRSKI